MCLNLDHYVCKSGSFSQAAWTHGQDLFRKCLLDAILDDSGKILLNGLSPVPRFYMTIEKGNIARSAMIEGKPAILARTTTCTVIPLPHSGVSRTRRYSGICKEKDFGYVLSIG